MALAAAAFINQRFLEVHEGVQRAISQLFAIDIINRDCCVTQFGPDGIKFYPDQWMTMRHWSRPLEYAWMLGNLELKDESQSILDAGGADSPFQFALALQSRNVINCDLEGDKLDIAMNLPFGRVVRDRIRHKQMDFLTFNESVDYVTCVSVLEHMEDPIGALKHFYRLLKPSGRLLFSFDIVDSPCKDFPIDLVGAQRILAEFGLDLPSRVEATSHTMPIEGKPRTLQVCCVLADKER